jgi:hypothetical protein
MIRAMALHCDHPGCDRRILGLSGPRSRRSKWLRPRVAEDGWVRSQAGRDLCPDHASEPAGSRQRAMEEPVSEG